MEENKKENKIEDRCFTVYMHISPSGKRYIGITSQNPPEKRWGKNGYKYKANKCFWNAIQKYNWENFLHEILFEDLTKEEAEQKEIELISYYKSDNNKFGYNIEHGGNCTGTHSDETKRKIGDKNKGKRRSEETIKKMSNAPKKPVCQYDLNGQLLKRYDSILEANISTNIESGNISACCKNKIKTAGGYIWQYDGVPLDLDNLLWHNSNNNNKSSICQYSMSGEFIKKYDSITNASIETNINAGLITMCCNGSRKTANGYIWRYADEKLTKQHIEWCNDNKFKKKPVLQYSLSYEIIRYFDGIKIASRETCIDPVSISRCCKGKAKTAGGYIWRYANEELRQTI